MNIVVIQIENHENPINQNILNISSILNFEIEWFLNETIKTPNIDPSSSAEKYVRKSITEKLNLPYLTAFQDDPETIKIFLLPLTLQCKLNLELVFSSHQFPK